MRKTRCLRSHLPEKAAVACAAFAALIAFGLFSATALADDPIARLQRGDFQGFLDDSGRTEAVNALLGGLAATGLAAWLASALQGATPTQREAVIKDVLERCRERELQLLNRYNKMKDALDWAWKELQRVHDSGFTGLRYGLPVGGLKWYRFINRLNWALLAAQALLWLKAVLGAKAAIAATGTAATQTAATGTAAAGTKAAQATTWIGRLAGRLRTATKAVALAGKEVANAQKAVTTLKTAHATAKAAGNARAAQQTYTMLVRAQRGVRTALAGLSKAKKARAAAQVALQAGKQGALKGAFWETVIGGVHGAADKIGGLFGGDVEKQFQDCMDMYSQKRKELARLRRQYDTQKQHCDELQRALADMQKGSQSGGRKP